MSADETLRQVILTADHCHGIVTRGGWQDACGKPPVAIIDDRDAEAQCYWPACAYHANRYAAGRCVALPALAEALGAAL